MTAIEDHETIWIEMPDGARLAARLWLPEGARGAPVPAILEYIPYRRRDRTRMRDESMHPALAAAGYACLRVDCRGHGDSDGVMRDEYAQAELDDGCDVIAWIAAQDWCDGQVAMFGKSWGAYNSFQIAAMRPPALRAIAPVMGCDDRWREDIHFYGGRLAGDNFWWGSVMQELNALPPDPEIVGDENWRPMWKERLEAMEFWPAMWAEHQTHDHWRHGSICEDYDAIQVPIYFFGGWADLFRDTPFRIAENMADRVKLLMGPWAHLYPHQAVPGPTVDFLGELIGFFDHHLKGRPMPEEPPLRFFILDAHPPHGRYEDRAGRWVEEAAWPSPNVADRQLWLNAGTLGDDAAEGEAMHVRSPQSYGMAGGDMCGFGTPGDLPVDGRIDAGGALLFLSEPMESGTDILGQPELTLEARTDAPGGLVAALLYDEAPDGAQTLISRGYANLAHLESDTDPRPVTPGEPLSITVPLHGCAYRVPKGHRLCLHVATAYWPVLWPGPEPLGLAIAPGRSRLAVPIRAATPDAPAPREMPPPAEAPPPRTTQVSEGAMARTIATDLETGLVHHRVFFDGGVFGPVGSSRLDDTGTVLSSTSERLHSIHPDDPLSARASLSQRAGFERGDWRATIECEAEMTCTAEAFRFRASVTCRDGDEVIHHVEWDRTVPRNGQ